MFQLLPYKRLTEMFSALYGMAISQGTIKNILKNASNSLGTFGTHILEERLKEKTLPTDETGARVGKALLWVHTVCSETLTWFGLHTKRGMEAIESFGILPRFTGLLVHDCWAPYFLLEACIHVICNAHILRELEYVETILNQDWARELQDFLCTALHEIQELRAKGSQYTAEKIAALNARFTEILEEGFAQNPLPPSPDGPKKRGRVKKSKPRNLLERLQTHQASILLFLTDPLAPFTNNLAERAFRFLKAKLKISGCFRSQEGALQFLLIRSSLLTVRKNDRNVLESLVDAFKGQPFLPKASSSRPP